MDISESFNPFTLSPEQQALFEALLEDEGIELRETTIAPRPDINERPLSSIQEQLWFMQQLAPESAFYNTVELLRLKGPLHIHLLETSLNKVVARHEILRSTFVSVGGSPKIVVAPELNISARIVDLEALPQEIREEKALQLANAETEVPIDLAHGPVLRSLLLKIQPEEYIAVLVAHHIICDGWSWGIITEELVNHYNYLLRKDPLQLPDLRIQYADYAYWQRQKLQGERQEQLIEYWKRQLAGSPLSMQLPIDFPRPEVQTFHGDHLSFDINRKSSDAFNELCQEEGATPFIGQLALYEALLYCFSKQNDILIGFSTWGRNMACLENLIGCFMNTLVLRTQVHGNLSFRELIGRVKETMMGAMAHQELPFEKLVEVLQPVRNAGQNQLLQVMISAVMVNGLSVPSLQDVSVQSIDGNTKTAICDLELYIYEKPEGIHGYFEYNVDLFQPRTIERLVQQYIHLLEQAITNPDQKIDDSLLLPPDEETRVRALGSHVSATVFQPFNLADLLRRHALYAPVASPDSVQRSKQSYRELYDQVNTVAASLSEADISISILNDRLHPVPIGMAGELYLSGARIVQEVEKQPALAASTLRHAPHPHGNQPAERLYKTGIRARWRFDGSLEILACTEPVVRGTASLYYPAEIEAVLLTHPIVRKAAVLWYQDRQGDQQLVAYVIPEEDKAETLEETLRSYLHELLPSSMLPAIFVSASDLPQTPDDEIDHHALQLLEGRRRSLASQQQSEEQTTPLQERIRQLWSDLLGHHHITLHESFFEMGGQSILAMQAIVQINEAFGLDLPLITLFEKPTIASLARLIEKVSQTAPSEGTQEETLSLPVRTDHIPLSFSQQWLWDFDSLEITSPYYNAADSIRIEGPLDKTALTRALQALVARHEILRTTFMIQDGQPVQIIHPAQDIQVAVIDLQSLSPIRQDKTLYELLREEVLAPFDLSQGPLLRVKIIALKERDHLLVINLHHLIYDGWSRGILTRELSLLYLSYSKGLPLTLPPLPCQYADYTLLQRQRLQGETLEKHLSYWRQQLANVQGTLPLRPPIPAHLATESAESRPSSATSPFLHGDWCPFSLSSEARARLIQLSEDHELTLFMTLLSLFYILLYIRTKQEDLVVYSRVADRNHAEQENLIGCFFKMVPLRVRLDGDLTLVEVFQRVRETCLGAYAHQEAPMGQIQQIIQQEAKTPTMPRIQAVFALNNFSRLDFGDVANDTRISIPPIKIPNHIMPFDLEFSLVDRDGELSGVVEYNTAVFSSPQMEELLQQFYHLIETLPAAPNTRVFTEMDERKASALAILPPTTKERPAKK